MIELINWQKIKIWIIEHYEDKSEADIKDLVWLRKKARSGEKLNWSFVDTLEYDIDSIPKKREIIFEFKPKKIGTVRQLLKNG